MSIFDVPCLEIEEERGDMMAKISQMEDGI